MIIGAIILTLRLHGIKSLKDKRSVIKRTKESVRNRFNASVAEVGMHDVHDAAQLGIALAGNDKSHLNSKADKIINFVESLALAELTDHEIVLVNI